MKLLLALVLTVGALANAAQYPVDEEIAKLRAKAQHLEDMKEVYLANNCWVQVGTNKVALTAGAMRSEGLVMAIGPNFPGNYAAYHQAPKPQLLAQVLDTTFNKAGSGKDAVIVSSQLGYDQSGKVVLIQVNVAEPYLEPASDGLWIYMKTSVRVKNPTEKQKVEATATLPMTKRTIAVGCN